MRHKKSFNHLGRTSSHRKAMLANMATSLIMHKRIITTLAKAKALRGYVEPLITKAKNDTTHSRRIVFKHLTDKYAVTELFREIAAKVGDRPGGYTRIIKLENRLGDNAEMAMIELVDFNENLLSNKTTKKTKTRRRRGGKKKSAETTVATEKVVESQSAQVDAKVKDEVKKEDEVKEEKVVDEPKAEAKEETKAEANDEPEAEAKEEPKAEAKDEDKEEDKKEDK